MLYVHDPAPPALPPSRLVARFALVAGELLTAAVIIAGGGWLTALASLR